MRLSDLERRKYEKAWSLPEYRSYSPGEEAIPVFRQLVKGGGSLVDLGCGTGRAGERLSQWFDVTLLDFAGNAPEVDLPFIRANLWTWRPKEKWDYGYCCDVMEHLPLEKVDGVLDNIFRACGRVFFSIHFGPDNFGEVVGHPLHLTVRPYVWWRDKIREFRELRDSRDCLGIGYFLT